MNIYEVIQSQYLAAFAMLEQVIEHCPESEWDSEVDKNRFWHVVFHALFYTHLYLQPAHADFVPYKNTHEDKRSLAAPENKSDIQPAAFSRAEMMAYLAFCKDQVQEILPILDLHGESGFDWLPFSKLELQFYNMRHLMQHTGELMERIWVKAGVEIQWMGHLPRNN